MGTPHWWDTLGATERAVFQCLPAVDRPGVPLPGVATVTALPLVVADAILERLLVAGLVVADRCPVTGRAMWRRRIAWARDGAAAGGAS